MAHPDLRKRIPIVLVVLLVAGGLTWWFLRPKPFLYAGTLEATEITLSPAVAASVLAYDCREGDEVRAGQTLVRLDGPDLRLNARLAEADFRRGEQLLADGSITPAAFDRLRTQKELTALQVGWLTVTAPADGTVLQKYREAGEWVRPGVNLLTLGNLRELWAFVYVEQPMLARLSAGQAVEGVVPELPGRTFAGRISLIRDQAEFTPKNVQTRDERTRLVYGVKVAFENPDRLLKPGMSIELELPEAK